jgi:membrane-associated HD superfamily phosphohydrolase
MTEHIDSVMLMPIVGSRSQFRRFGVSGIVRRDLKTGQEVVITDLSQVRDKLTASASLKSEKLIWPAEYSTKDRKLLGEILGSLIVPNLEYNEAETEKRKAQMRDGVPPAMVIVGRGNPIVSRGQTVSTAQALLLAEATRHRPIGQRAIEFAGTLIIVMLLLVLWRYMVRYQHQHQVRRHFLLQITCFVITLGLARLFFTFASAMSQWSTHTPFNSPTGYRYLAPLAVGAVMVTILTDANAAFIFSAILSVFVGVFSGNVYLATFTLVSSAGAIYHLQKRRTERPLWLPVFGSALSTRPRLWRWTCSAQTNPDCGSCFSTRSAVMVGFGDDGGIILLPLFEWYFSR